MAQCSYTRNPFPKVVPPTRVISGATYPFPYFPGANIGVQGGSVIRSGDTIILDMPGNIRFKKESAHLSAGSYPVPNAAWLISVNPLDVIGAAAALSLRTARVRRSAAQPFAPWGVAPDPTLDSLGGLQAAPSDRV